MSIERCWRIRCITIMVWIIFLNKFMSLLKGCCRQMSILMYILIVIIGDSDGSYLRQAVVSEEVRWWSEGKEQLMQLIRQINVRTV